MRYLLLCMNLVAGIFTSHLAEAQTEHDPQSVLAYQGDQVLTQNAVDGAFNRIPEKHRMAVIRDGNKVEILLTSMMMNKIMAADAYKAGLDQDPLIQERMKLAAEEELALAWKEKLLSKAPAADYDTMAYESYLARQEEFLTKEVLDVSHILISTKNRSEDEAAELAASIRLQLREDPDRFDALVLEYSEDPGKDANKGRFSSVVRGQMVKPFEHTAFAMTDPGEISEPVKSGFGYHIIRFNARQEPEQLDFAQVKAGLIEKAIRKHELKFRDTYMSQLLIEPLKFPDGALEIMVKRHFGENLELAPDFYSHDTEGED